MSNTASASDINPSLRGIHIRHQDEANPMLWEDRLAIRAKRLFAMDRVSENPLENNDVGDDPKKRKSSIFSNEEDDEIIDGKNNNNEPMQFRFEPVVKISTTSFLRDLFGWRASESNTSSDSFSSLFGLNSTLSYYLHYMFRGDFCLVVAGMCFAFFGLVFVFTLFIAISGAADPQCLIIGGTPFGEYGSGFAEAFGLSWVTFSTVGYGTSYPALGYQNDNWANCFFVSMICSFEAFTGIMFGGFCGAILFGKVLRMQSDALVTFSDPIVIRFGNGVSSEASAVCNWDDELEEDEVPFPVLEFRIVNQLWNEVGTEILDATLSVVANVDEGTHSSGSDSASLLDQEGTIRSNSATSSLNAPSEHKHFLTKGRLRQSLFHGRVAMEEIPSSRSVAKHVYSRMELETNEHPYFNRVWVVRHRLDENSPLLRDRERNLIRINGGKWPKRLNNAKAIRKSLNFNAILVSLNGVANISAAAVYAQKIYDYGDVHIGYKFVNVLYRDDEKSLGVDMELINDIQEQVGGGAEPLITTEE